MGKCDMNIAVLRCFIFFLLSLGQLDLTRPPDRVNPGLQRAVDAQYVEW